MEYVKQLEPVTCLKTCVLSFLTYFLQGCNMISALHSLEQINGKQGGGGGVRTLGNHVIILPEFSLVKSPTLKKKDKYSQGYQTHISTSFVLLISSSSHA